VGVIYVAQVPTRGLTRIEQSAADPKSSGEFYKEVAGLTAALGPYFMPTATEQSLGGQGGAGAEERSGESEGPEPSWMAYIGVQDVDAAAERARHIGGHVLLPPTEVPGLGRAAVLRDPQGLAFGIFTPAP